MKKQESGFTLIELVVVIVILGILAAVAVPRYIDMRAQAATAALNGVRGGIESASAINFAARTANPLIGVGTTGSTCAVAAAAIMQGGVVPAGYAVAGLGGGNLVDGDNACTLTDNAGNVPAGIPVNIIGIQ